MRRIIIRYMQLLPRRFQVYMSCLFRLLRASLQNRAWRMCSKCDLQGLRLKADLGESIGQFVIEHYSRYLGFSRHFVVDPMVFYEVVMERVYAQYTKELRVWRMM